MTAVVTKKHLTPAQKRVLIAKDALAQIRAGKLKVESGNGFVVFNAIAELALENAARKDSSVELQKVLPKVINHCTVCAIGSLFISHVRKFNKFKVKNINDLAYDLCPRPYLYKGCQSPGSNKLLRYFTVEQLAMVEAAFEGYWNNNFPRNICPYVYGDIYPSDKKRLIVILKNIIRNNGTFVPELNDKGKPY